ncbi:16S rRNA (cytosine(1402)-N(4))-methyltransferase RsmH [Sediminitomix flava]|uniref:Ribosomal RNA small subunit methyltransferase H n=1 Tax=Sediminitomix flava TaxID=379075 RepID=A0A315Z9V5_SEDFL|nr:16S rRNA (cytosine(1402)-N(4))-methyltransferase RsmH [Sediminitomix flava]PWJ42062.1 16S rRNA (cytosine1402-N4)-methyltransferase [Sediminitomix flava]
MYHIPVMLEECLDWLKLEDRNTYVDVTFGGGGHSKAILERISNGKLVAFDQDQDAKKNADKIENEQFLFVQSNFRNLKRFLRLHNQIPVDGILADLGISSHQIDCGERGFSTRFDAELDMRMDQSAELSAKELIHEYDEADLIKIFKLYGELKNARKVASIITRERLNSSIETTGDLMRILSSCAPKGKENRYFAQLFQAIRIEVNNEMGVLEEMLSQCAEVLKPGGRLVVMSYHSLEDRLVKNFMKFGNFEGKPEKDFYGNLIRPLKPNFTKPIVASSEEISQNRRARSAKLRVAEKL